MALGASSINSRGVDDSDTRDLQNLSKPLNLAAQKEEIAMAKRTPKMLNSLKISY